MKPIEIIAQGIGIVAMFFNIISYQSKKQSSVIALQLCGGALFAVNYLLLGATVGGILNILATLRAIIFLFKKKLKADRLPWLFAFIACFIAVYVLNFTLFGKEPTAINLIIEILPVIGMTALSVGFRLKSAADVRRCGLISSPSWLIYNIYAGSWGAIICEIFTLASIFIGMLRHDKKPRKQQQ
ncbi:MAG: YgjV family protein [Clostridia bacterium]|nr:YgjV family protein [Clostridia bacterium]